MQKILVYTEKITPRIQYIFDFILKEFSGLDVELTTNVQFFEASNQPKISYSKTALADEFHLDSDEFMFQSDFDQNLKEKELNPVGKCFFALSRYEEYFPTERDHHKRFPGKNRAYKTPFVDQWILDFQKKLLVKYPDLKFKERKFEIVLTCDVDQAWQYHHKGFKRTYGALMKDLAKFNLSEFQKRRAILSGKIQDPYDSFELFKKAKEENSIRMIFFWLMGDYAQFDKNNPVTIMSFQKKIREISSWAEFGIHPSYASNSNSSKLKVEIQRLSKVLGQPITKSRQHYLKLEFPKTYRNLIENGIKEDHTMAYADETGFRAGTTTPFFWYDLEAEKQTDLKVIPFCAMDVSMRNYMKLSKEEALLELKRLKKEVQKVNGQMVVLFHNSNFRGDWEGWEEVMFSMF
jgi:hypothetical protein